MNRLFTQGRWSYLQLGFLCGVFSLILVVVLFGCQNKPRSNPLDPGGTSFQIPFVNFSSIPYDGDTLRVDSVYVAWTGNTPNNVYRYELTNILTNENYYPLINWDTITTITLKHLDDAPYEFKFETQYSGEDRDSIFTIRFSVKTLATPSLLFMRKYKKVNMGDQFEIEVWVNRVQGLFAGDLAIGFDKNAIQLVNVSKGDISPNQLVTPDYSLSKIVSSANSVGRIGISTAFLSSTNSIISGTGSILKITFRAIRSGQTRLSFLTSDLRDINDNPLTISQVQTAIVEVK